MLVPSLLALLLVVGLLAVACFDIVANIGLFRFVVAVVVVLEGAEDGDTEL